MADKMDAEWEHVDALPNESMADRTRRVVNDVGDIQAYYRVVTSPTRYRDLKRLYASELHSLYAVHFDNLDQQGRVDYIKLRDYLQRGNFQLLDEQKKIKQLAELTPYAPNIVYVSEGRERADDVSAEDVAKQLDTAAKLARGARDKILKGRTVATKTDAYKAAGFIRNMASALDEVKDFYSAYDPMFDWWASQPLKEAQEAIAAHLETVEQKLVGLGEENKDEIIGQPIGREALLVELQAEMITYTPEQLVDIAKEVFQWCEKQMRQASNELGFGNDWKKALDHVKSQTLPPGEHPHFVKQLTLEGAEYVRSNNLLTVPPVAEMYRMNMLSAEEQKQSPFFLGGDGIMVAYPTRGMGHDLKKMVMRGNNRSFARATAFHELIPGHKMEFYYMQRYNTHRGLFTTPFWIEGWALYWELVLWHRKDFFVTPEDRIGTLFWRMHRCARIIFSLSFHLGTMTPQQCVDLLVNRVGHERANAESEVRRSFAGDYSPLYQAGYLLGAMQIWKVREEVLASGKMGEKQMHDAIMRNGCMPIELMRALLLDKPLTADYKPQWEFYSGPPE